MNQEVRDETRRRLAEIDVDLANDEVEIERQMPDVLRRMIEDADISSRHYKRIADEAITPRYRELYQQQSDFNRDEAERLRNIIL